MDGVAVVAGEWNTVKVEANPGYMRVKYNDCARHLKKPMNDGLSLERALSLVGGSPVRVVVGA